MSPRHSPQLPLLALSLAPSSLGAEEEALSASRGWHSRGVSGEAPFPLPRPVGQRKQVRERRVCPDSQYLELNWARACAALQLLATDPGHQS